MSPLAAPPGSVVLQRKGQGEKEKRCLVISMEGKGCVNGGKGRREEGGDPEIYTLYGRIPTQDTGVYLLDKLHTILSLCVSRMSLELMGRGGCVRIKEAWLCVPEEWQALAAVIAHGDARRLPHSPHNQTQNFYMIIDLNQT